MAVTFDAVGPSSSGAGGVTSPLAWTHTVGGGVTNGVILIAVNFDTGSSGTMSMAATCSTGIVTSLGFIDTFGHTTASTLSNGWIQAWIVTGVSTGANSISVSCTPTGNLGELSGGSLSFSGCLGWGTPVLTGTQSGTGTNATETVTGVASTSQVAAFLASGNTIDSTIVTGHAGWTQSESSSNDTGSSAGAYNSGTGSVSVEWNTGSSSWCGIAVELQAGALSPLNYGPLPNRPAVIVSNAGWRGAGHSR